MKGFVGTYGPALATGALLALSFPKWGLYPLAWIALVPLLCRAHRLTGRACYGHFVLAGWFFYSLQCYWLTTNVYWAGGWALVGQQILCLIMAQYWGAFGLLWHFVRKRSPKLGGVLGITLLWAAMEQLQGTLFTGFGWGAIAYSQGPNLRILQWAVIGGATLVSAIVVLVNALIMQGIVHRKRLRCAVAAAAVVLATHAVGYSLLGEADYTSRPFKVGLFQSNFPLEMKRDSEYTIEMVRNAAQKSRSLVEHERTVNEAPVDLMLWPEALIMADIQTPAIHEAVTAFTRDTNTSLFTGSARDAYDPEAKQRRAFNSSYLIDADGQIGEHYDKIHLAPFGEYVPLSSLMPFVKQVVPSIGAMESGVESKVFDVKNRRLGPLICFEVLFSPMAERLRSQGADFLVVITNLAWFGASNAIEQEIDIARVRAIETRLPLVHCANTGISGVFDPWGRLTLLNGSVDSNGRYYGIRKDLRPAETIGARLVGAAKLAAPAQRPFGWAPAAFPWFTVAAAAAITATSVLLGLNKNSSANAKEQSP